MGRHRKTKARRSKLMEAPPALTSSRYAADLNEVKLLGGACIGASASALFARLWGRYNIPFSRSK